MSELGLHGCWEMSAGLLSRAVVVLALPKWSIQLVPSPSPLAAPLHHPAGTAAHLGGQGAEGSANSGGGAVQYQRSQGCACFCLLTAHAAQPCKCKAHGCMLVVAICCLRPGQRHFSTERIYGSAGLHALVRSGVIPDSSPAAAAAFLCEHAARLDKGQVGELFGHHGDHSIAVSLEQV